MSPEATTTAVTETKATKTTKKAPAKKAAKKTAKKAPAKKTLDNPQHEIRWSEKKIALLRALRKAGATDGSKAVSKEKIDTLSNGKALSTLSPKFDLTIQGYIGVAQSEESRELLRFITKKGLAFLTNFEKK